MPDYFAEVEAAIRDEQSRDPDAVLPWSWWQRQAQRHDMTPNAVYTRAVKSGAYTPPSKRGPQGSAAPEPPPGDDHGPSGPRRTGSLAPESGGPTRDGEAGHSRNGETIHPRDGEWDERASLLSPSIGGAIQGFASLVERTAGLEQQVAELKRALDQTQAENRRLRRALQQADALAAQVAQVYRSALIQLPDEND